MCQSFSGLFGVCLCSRGQDFHGLTLDQFSVKKPEYWDDSVASPARVHVAKDTPEWALVTSKFHVNGFNKPIIGIERVQVWSCGGRGGTVVCSAARSELLSWVSLTPALAVSR